MGEDRLRASSALANEPYAEGGSPNTRCFERHALRLLRDKDGNFAVLTAVASVPLICAASIAVDYTNANFEAEKLQAALDGATLRAAQLYGQGQTEAQATEAANEVFFGNWTRSLARLSRAYDYRCS